MNIDVYDYPAYDLWLEQLEAEEDEDICPYCGERIISEHYSDEMDKVYCSNKCLYAAEEEAAEELQRLWERIKINS